MNQRTTSSRYAFAALWMLALALLALLHQAPCRAQSGPIEWQTFEPKEAHIRIQVPGTPKRTEQSDSHGRMIMWEAEKAPDIDAAIMWIRVAAHGRKSSAAATKLLSTFMRKSMADDQYALDSSSDVIYKGRKGRQMIYVSRASVNGQHALLRMRMFQKGTTILVVFSSVVKSEAGSKLASHFLNSLVFD
ncbi:MAG TPA: hypothetical protein VKT77_07410 [Chthonomonadaceae bacterium]|nr:hypothetical protein [Chthonomonadaceae bacterium]